MLFFTLKLLRADQLNEQSSLDKSILGRSVIDAIPLTARAMTEKKNLVAAFARIVRTQ
jgi:hypothetical protein